MLQLTQIVKTFTQEPLFEGLDLRVGDQSRLGLIGRNGCGKSTLLKLMAGLLLPDKGSIQTSPKFRVGYLSQEPQLDLSLTLEQEMASVFKEINTLKQEESLLFKQLEVASIEEQPVILKRLDTLGEDLKRLNAGLMDAQIGRILKGLGFPQDALQKNVSEFSGGWRMRINLAKVLLSPVDLLLLDEPTNHLDLDACEWLECFLTEYPGAIVVVSHDRHFLDKTVTEIAELELGKITHWTGNYTQFIQQKEEQMALMAAAYQRQQKELETQTAFVERFRASATRSTQAKSREKQLNKIERLALPETDTRQVKMRFPPLEASGKQVLTLRGLSKAFGDKVLFKNVNADVQRHQRIFLLGANGCGKTTLLRVLLGLEPADAGEIRPGHQVSLGYFSQHQLETLNPQLSAFETIHNACPQYNEGQVRGLLARFLLNKDQVLQPVAVFSGGEKSKVALAKLMVEGPNTLLLDEPTNHLDLPAKEALAEAIADYEGTVVCISHDRYFIQRLATHIWEIYEGHLIQYAGNYDYYLSKRDELRGLLVQPKLVTLTNQTVTDKKESSKSPLQQRREIEKQITQLEKLIMRLEHEIVELSLQFNDPERLDPQAMIALNHQLEEKNHALTHANTQWEALINTLS